MAYSMVPIYTQTVGTGGATIINFNNIPATYTDLKLVVSSREIAISDYRQPLFLKVNNVSSGWSDTTIIPNLPGGPLSTRNSYGAGSVVMLGYASGVTATANTFSSIEAYFPNYNSSNYKQVISDSVVANAASTNSVSANISACLWSSTAAITSMQITTYTTFAQNSTFTLYGIKAF